MSRNDDKEDRKEIRRALSFWMQIGPTIIACVAIGVFIGRLLDNLLGTSPWLLLVFTVLGAAAGFKSIIDLANKKD